MRPTAPPPPSEYPAWYTGYLAELGEVDPVEALAAQEQELIELLGGLDEGAAGYRYADGKWSIREVVGHLIDVERIMSCRLLRIARGDQTLLPAFDENLYVPASGAEQRTLPDLLAEYRAVRAATLALVRGLPDGALERLGAITAGPISARALLYIIPGHERHHLTIFRERYLVK